MSIWTVCLFELDSDTFILVLYQARERDLDSLYLVIFSERLGEVLKEIERECLREHSFGGGEVEEPCPVCRVRSFFNVKYTIERYELYYLGTTLQKYIYFRNEGIVLVTTDNVQTINRIGIVKL